MSFFQYEDGEPDEGTVQLWIEEYADWTEMSVKELNRRISEMSRRNYNSIDALEICTQSREAVIDMNYLAGGENMPVSLKIEHFNTQYYPSLRFLPSHNNLNLRSLTLSRFETRNLAEAVANCSELTHLRLEVSCDLNLPSAIYGRKLELLSVTGTKELTRMPEGIEKCRRLKYLYWTKTSVRSIPEGISDLRNLQHVDLKRNLLESCPPLRLHHRGGTNSFNGNRFRAVPDWITELSDDPNVKVPVIVYLPGNPVATSHKKQGDALSESPQRIELDFRDNDIRHLQPWICEENIDFQFTGKDTGWLTDTSSRVARIG